MIQGRVDRALREGGMQMCWWKLLDSGHVLKVDPMGFVGRLDKAGKVGCYKVGN